jgi:PAS domain S-box-containing protein
MKWLSPRMRISLAMASVVVVFISLANMLGLLPDAEQATVQGRARMCESIALSGSALVASGDAEAMAALLQAMVDRDKQLQSIGVRTVEGELLMAAGPHAQHWSAPPEDRSTPDLMQVPIYKSGDEKWATLEFRYTPLHGDGLWNWLMSPRLHFMAFISAASFLAFTVILRAVLKHLDPSKAVPRRVREALDNLAEGLVILDTSDQILLANSAFAAVIGVPPEKLVGVRAPSLPWRADEADSALSYPWTVALEQRRPVSNVRMQLEDLNGRCQSFNVNCSPLLGSGGRYCGVMVTFDDVTALDQKNVELGKAKQAAEVANEAKSAFLANMSHEIRTPMNAIMGFADVLRRGMEETHERRVEYLDVIHRSGTHLIELINDVLDLSKIEAGKLSVEITETNPYCIMRDVVDVLRVRAEQADITLECDVEGQIPETIHSDSTRLRQILINLAGNAVKFTKEGGVKLTCRTASDGDVPRLEFVVADTGIGMTEEQIERIFSPFEQADSSVTRRFGGTGLGLSISKRLAEALGGDIQVHSTPGQGSTFTVAVEAGSLDGVRMLNAGNAALLLEREEQPKRSATNVRLRPSRVLLVDDGESNRQLITVLLGRAGVEILEAVNGAEALERIDENSFDLVLLDMQMPVMDGYEAARRMRELGHSLPIVAMTANAMQGDEEKCQAAGCSHFLMKPIDIDQLFELLATLLGELEPGMTTRAASLAPAVTMPPASGGKELEPCESDRGVATQSAEHGQFVCSELQDPELRPVIEKFVGSLIIRLQEMLADYAQHDFQSLADHAHWLKGAGGTVGFNVFTEPAARLESQANNESLDEIAQTLRELVDLTESIRLDEQEPATSLCQ